jgi:hypothetical protein
VLEKGNQEMKFLVSSEEVGVGGTEPRLLFWFVGAV